MERLNNAKRTLEIQQKFAWEYNTCNRHNILLKGEIPSSGATFGGKSLPKPRDLPAWGEVGL
jgi:hypothetical protein